MPSCTLEHLGKSPHTLVHRQDGKYVDTKGHERSAERGILQSSISNSFSEEEWNNFPWTGMFYSILSDIDHTYEFQTINSHRKLYTN